MYGRPHFVLSIYRPRILEAVAFGGGFPPLEDRGRTLRVWQEITELGVYVIVLIVN